MDKLSMLIFIKHECLQPCSTEVPYRVLHRCYYLMPQTASIQDDCRLMNSNKRKDDNDLGWSTI